MSRELIPNSFQTPNFLVDKLLRHLSGPQAKVMMVLCRKTFGWNKREDVISFGQFRDEAGVSRSSVTDALRTFVSSGLVTKTKRGTLEMSAWSLNLDADPEKVLAHLMADAGIVRPAAYTAQRPSPPVVLERPAVQEYTARRPIDSPPVGPTETQLNTKPKRQPSNTASSGVEEVWEYYREKLDRSPHLELTKQRRSMGEAGLGACFRMAKLTGASDPQAAAVELMKLAVDRLSESSWHNGVNDRNAKYLDWEILFRGKNLPCPQKLTQYWLDDEKWGAA